MFELIVGGLGFIISTLLVVIGFFLKQMINSVAILREAISEMKTAVNLLEQGCYYKHKDINERINKIEQHGN